MNEENFNLELIINILDLEIKEYKEKQREKNTIESNISLIKEMIKILDSENYELMRENILLFDSIIPLFFNMLDDTSNNIIERLNSAIIHCINYTKNQEKYSKNDFDKDKRYIKNLITKLDNELNKQIAKSIKIVSDLSEEDIINYQAISEKLKCDSSVYKKYNKIITPQDKKKTIITSPEYDTLIKLFERKKLTEKQKIIFLELIKTHNIKTHYINENKIDQTNFNEIINIELMGFEDFEDISWIEDKRKAQLDLLIDTIINQGISITNNKIDDEIIKEMLPKYKGNLTFSNGYTINNIKYLYTSILKKYQKDLFECYKDLNELNNYRDKETREIIIQTYRELMLKYNYIRSKMDEEINKYKKDIEKIKDGSDDIKKLHYGVKASDITFLESDLKDVPKDTYSSIKELLMLFRKDKLTPSQTKQLNEVYPGISEIRDDQIRITYKHLKNNEYVILGVFIKKDNNPIKQYRIYCNRTPASIIDSKAVEEEIFSNLTHHTGGRRNS